MTGDGGRSKHVHICLTDSQYPTCFILKAALPVVFECEQQRVRFAGRPRRDALTLWDVPPRVGPSVRALSGPESSRVLSRDPAVSG